MLSPVQVAYLGSSAQFTCFSYKKPAWFSFNNIWFFNYEIVKSYNGVSETIAITRVKPSDKGIYRCTGVDAYDRKRFKTYTKLYIGG